MAHFKRKRSRTSPSGGYSGNAYKHRLGDRFDNRAWYRNYPRDHDKIFHTRPRRRKERQLERKILTGSDADGLAWPLAKKPHTYFW
jgi:hypothetical protein